MGYKVDNAVIMVAGTVSPFTGRVIDSSEKIAHEQYVIMSHDWDVATNNGNTFFAF